MVKCGCTEERRRNRPDDGVHTPDLGCALQDTESLRQRLGLVGGSQSCPVTIPTRERWPIRAQSADSQACMQARTHALLAVIHTFITHNRKCNFVHKAKARQNILITEKLIWISGHQHQKQKNK